MIKRPAQHTFDFADLDALHERQPSRETSDALKAGIARDRESVKRCPVVVKADDNETAAQLEAEAAQIARQLNAGSQ